MAATNKDLKDAVKKGMFREDLFFRLDVITLKLPPLRERQEDIPDLAAYALGRRALTASKRPLTISPSAMTCLIQYHWPGNVRELENVLARAAILCDTDAIEPVHLRLSGSEDLRAKEGDEASTSTLYYVAMDRYGRNS